MFLIKGSPVALQASVQEIGGIHLNSRLGAEHGYLASAVFVIQLGGWLLELGGRVHHETMVHGLADATGWVTRAVVKGSACAGQHFPRGDLCFVELQVMIGIERKLMAENIIFEAREVEVAVAGEVHMGFAIRLRMIQYVKGIAIGNGIHDHGLECARIPFLKMRAYV